MSMLGDYKPGGLSELMRGSQSGDNVCTDTRLQALFSPGATKIKEKKTSKRKIVDNSTHGDENSESMKKKKKQKKVESVSTASPVSDDKIKQQKKTKIKQSLSSEQQKVERKENLPSVLTDEVKTFQPVKSHKDAAEKLARTVFAGNLPKTSTKKSIKSLFQQCGKIDSVRLRSAAPANLKLPKKAVVIKREFHAERQNINAYVVFKNLSGAKKALALNGTEVEGLHLRVDLADDNQQHDHKKSIFVGNLPFTVHEDAIRDHFAACGTIKNVRLIRDAKTGLGKGFGYVLFEDTDSVTLALKTSGETFESRKLRIERSSYNAANKIIKQKHKVANNMTNRKGTKAKLRMSTDTNTTKPKVYKDRKEQRRKRKLLKQQRKSTATSMAARKPSASVLIRNRMAKKMKKKQ